MEVPPLAIVPLFDQTRGVRLGQLVQTGPATLRVRLDVEPGQDADIVWAELAGAVAARLATQGLGNVEVRRAGLADPVVARLPGGLAEHAGVTGPPHQHALNDQRKNLMTVQRSSDS